MMAEHKGWKLRPDGEIELNPMVGYGTATLPEGACALLLEYVSDPAQPLETPNKLQLAMTRDQVSELIQALQRMADAPHIEEPPTDSKH